MKTSKLEMLRIRMRELEYNGDISETDYRTFNALTECADMLLRGRALIAEAMDTHIYNEADGEGPDESCEYLAFLNTADSITEGLK